MNKYLEALIHSHELNEMSDEHFEILKEAIAEAASDARAERHLQICEKVLLKQEEQIERALKPCKECSCNKDEFCTGFDLPICLDTRIYCLQHDIECGIMEIQNLRRDKLEAQQISADVNAKALDYDEVLDYICELACYIITPEEVTLKDIKEILKRGMTISKNS